jgi:hypothetical protein
MQWRSDDTFLMKGERALDLAKAASELKRQWPTDRACPFDAAANRARFGERRARVFCREPDRRVYGVDPQV